ASATPPRHDRDPAFGTAARRPPRRARRLCGRGPPGLAAAARSGRRLPHHRPRHHLARPRHTAARGAVPPHPDHDRDSHRVRRL
ncbi:MAG: hypothetical protein AVDCRST_MAG18-4665, partial [uncultured Thermomicrobiales bacterium]